MAESGFPSNNDIKPSSSSSSAAGAPDWEMLTMSMSSSALGDARGDTVEHESEKSSHRNESSNERSPKAEGDSQVDPLHSSIRTDANTDTKAERFIEGWNSRRSSSSDLHGNVSEQSRQEQMRLTGEADETYIESTATPNVPYFSEKDDRDVENRALEYGPSVDEIKSADKAVNEKIKRKGEKHSKRCSTFVWSIAVVASLTGILFLGNCLRIAYNQNQQLEIQLSAKDEELNEMLIQVNRLRKVLGNHPKAPLSGD